MGETLGTDFRPINPKKNIVGATKSVWIVLCSLLAYTRSNSFWYVPLFHRHSVQVEIMILL